MYYKMSFYNSAITTHLIDPVYNSANQRSEWRLTSPDSLYLSNLRLLNVGVRKTISEGETKYNELVGAYGCIRRIQLLDGSVQLDALNNVPEWLAFRNYAKPNTDNVNMNTELVKNSLGFVFEGLDISGGFARLDVYPPSGQVTHLETTTKTSWLSLKDILPFLSASMHLSTATFKNLRLVIEWETDKTKLVSKVDNELTTIQPVLVADEMNDSPTKMKLMKDFKGVNYVTIETDRVVVPSVPGVRLITPNPEQRIRYLVQGFNNKKVNRMLIVKTPTVSTSWLNGNVEFATRVYGKVASLGMVEEAHQFTVNGSSLYPGEGVTKYNQCLARLQDAWGVTTQPCGYAIFHNGIGDLFADAEEKMAHTSYIGANLFGERIRELQFTYARKGQYDADYADTDAAQSVQQYNQQLILNMFAEVQRVLIVQPNGSYTVSYV